MKWTPKLQARAEAMRARPKPDLSFPLPRVVPADCEQLPGGLSSLALSKPYCARCYGLGHTPRGLVCPCVHRRLGARPDWMLAALWESWVESNGGPCFPRSTWELQAMRYKC